MPLPVDQLAQYLIRHLEASVNERETERVGTGLHAFFKTHVML